MHHDDRGLSLDVASNRLSTTLGSTMTGISSVRIHKTRKNHEKSEPNYIRVRIVIICFYILSGLDCSESFHIGICMTQVTCSYISIIHYLGLSIYVHMLVSRLKSDCDCYFYCTFNTLTTQFMVVIDSIFIRSFISDICIYVVFLSHNH